MAILPWYLAGINPQAKIFSRIDRRVGLARPATARVTEWRRGRRRNVRIRCLTSPLKINNRCDARCQQGRASGEFAPHADGIALGLPAPDCAKMRRNTSEQPQGRPRKGQIARLTASGLCLPSARSILPSFYANPRIYTAAGFNHSGLPSSWYSTRRVMPQMIS